MTDSEQAAPGNSFEQFAVGGRVRELLAETEDAELQAITEQAARDFGAPIALVTILLEQVQFFKAHYGLPKALSACRASRRDASFCQMVVQREETFGISDAATEDVPKFFWEEFNIRSYLGVPVRLEGVVIGSLCILDTQPGAFDNADRAGLERLALAVEARANVLTQRRAAAENRLRGLACGPALAALKAAMSPARACTQHGVESLVAIRAFLRLSQDLQAGVEISPGVASAALRAAQEGLQACEAALDEIQADWEDCADYVEALQRLSPQSRSIQLSHLLIAAQDLSRALTEDVGGAPLPSLCVDPLVGTSPSLGVSLMTTSYRLLAEQLRVEKSRSGIRSTIQDLGSEVCVSLAAQKAEELRPEIMEFLSSEVNRLLEGDPGIRIMNTPESLDVYFRVLRA